MANKDPMTKLLTKVNAIVTFGNVPVDLIKDRMQVIVDWLNEVAESYGIILHDRDIDDDGKLKTPHVHCVFRLKKRCRKSTLINRFADFCEVSTLAVTLDGATSYEGSFQYLIHKNDPNKFQYSPDLIRTNMTAGEIEIIMDATPVALDLPSLKAACLNTDCLVDVIEFVGLSVYQHYRATIKDIFDWAQWFRKQEDFTDKRSKYIDG